MRHVAVIVATVIVAVAVVAGSGCFTVNAELPGAIRNDKPEVEKIGSVNIEKDNYFFILGLVGDPPKDFFSTEIKKQVQSKGGDGVANLTYESSDGCFDLIITGCTLGCVAPRTYKVTGDIVRIKSARLPGKPAKTVENARPAGESRVAQSY
jgi:hypothetical protein